MSRDALLEIGIDLDELQWQDLALCAGMETDTFYDGYEASNEVASMVDQACLSCPVMAQCLQRGVDNGEWGVWGGIYLVSGKPDSNKNKHKTPDIWESIREKIGGESIL